jgi:3-deoxy-D-manno-octulosonic-acid transferase
MMRFLYRLLTDVAGLPLRAWLILRARRGKEAPARLPERRGFASRPRPEGRLVWFHGASVGESLSILPLTVALHDNGWSVLVTTGTVTSAALLAERLPPGCIHQFVPLDRRAWARTFLDHWHPNLVLWTESDLWPNILGELAHRRTPAVLVNGRLSDRSFAGWQRRAGFARQVLSAFDMVLAQSALDGERFRTLGAHDVRVLGNLKLAAPPLPYCAETLAALRRNIAGRPLWLAASIHPGEDTIAAEVHRRLRGRFPGLLTLIVPRHADKGAAMAEIIASMDLRVALRGNAPAIARETEVYIADTMGELGVFFRLSDLVFVGKSLAVGGGQNPAEPAQIGCALILGPDMSNFREIATELITAGAACQIDDLDALASTVGGLLAAPIERTRMTAAGRAIMTRHASAVADTLGALEPFLKIR